MQERVSWREIFTGDYAMATLLVNIGIMVHAIDVLILTTILPAMVRDIGGAHYYTWSTMLYMVSSIIGAASVGNLRQRAGLKRAYLAGAFGFLLGSIGCALAYSMPILLVFRFIQGLGGGILIALSIGMVGESFPERIKKRVLALISGSWGLAALLGPAVGGFFADFISWRGAFWVNVPILFFMLWVAYRILPENHGKVPPKRLPWLRLGLLTFAVLQIGLAGQSYPLLFQMLLIGGGILCLFATFRLDAEAHNRLFPPHPFSLRSLRGAAYWVMYLSSITHTVIGIFLPLALQAIYGASALTSGYIAAILAFCWTIASMATSGIHGVHALRLIIIGQILCVAGLAGLAIGNVHLPLWAIPALSGLTGLGLGASNLHLTEAFMRQTRQDELALTSSSMPTIRSLGIAFGAAFSGIIANAAGLGDNLQAEDVARATSWVLAIGLLAPLVALAFSWRFYQFVMARASGT